MVNAVFCLTVFVLQCVLISAVMKIPPYLKACSRRDPKYRECAVKSGNDAMMNIVQGDRKYHFANMNPLLIPGVSVDDRGGPVGLKISLADVKVHGMGSTILQDFSVDLDKKVMAFQVEIPRCMALCTYDISGKILILPVVGKGDANFTLLGLNIKFVVNFDVKEKKNGVTHMVLKELVPDFVVRKAYLRLENLFNGDKLLGEQVNIVINDNWEVLIEEIGTPIIGAISQSVQQGFNYLVDQVPLDELFKP